ncbi:MAG: T9SS type A sorting domain-containing protein, partial [Candidatus Coatesbacteria bacterium]
DETPARAASFALRPLAPNPVTGAATFSFELAEAAAVRLAVYDAAGRKVATVAEGHYAAGVHDVPFRAELAPGVYVYRLEAGGEAAARKMVVAE